MKNEGVRGLSVADFAFGMQTGISTQLAQLIWPDEGGASFTVCDVQDC